MTTEQQIQELKDLLYRKTGPSPVGTSGYTIVRNTINNYSVKEESRIFEAIVDVDGRADYTSLEDAIDYVLSIGGGDIFVRAGTYTISRNIATITKPINIIGVNSALAIIDFNSTARNFVINSGTAYTTGTISSITGTAVVGSSTSWNGNVTAGQYMLVGTRWYLIAVVVDDTHITLAEAFDEKNVSFAANYRIVTLTRNILFESLTIKNSTGTAIAVTDCRDFFLNDVVLLTNNKGFVLTGVSSVTITSAIVAGSTSNGWEMTNCGLLTIRGLAAAGNGGHGGVISNVEAGGFSNCASNANTSDGLNITSGFDLDLNYLANSNGGQGIELVATNNAIRMIDCSARSNTSDGIKLTASSDYCKIIGGHFDTNGGWGINVAAATDDKNVVVGNSFNGNVSGTITDSGTGTVSASNTT